MQFPLTQNLLDYDVYPKVFAVGKETEIHIRPLGRRPQFKPNTDYVLYVCALTGSNPDRFPATGDYRRKEIRTDSEGAFTFKHTFDSEQEYYLRIYPTDSMDNRINQFPVFAVESDLAGRYPFIGDLHMHTLRSDGSQSPAVVAANYRKYGYDFTVISDHDRYYPSLEAIDAYKDADIEMTIVPGEEVHLPEAIDIGNDMHIVNFGGEFSINALIEGNHNKEAGTDWKVRSLTPDCPDIMTQEEYSAVIKKIISELEVEEGLDAEPLAISKWIYDMIKKAGGLGIFAHPFWIANTFHVSDKMTDYIMKNKWFDAFEVLGGENYYEQNGFQTHLYYDNKAAGINYPVVGSTDSHNSYEDNGNALICKTIVFAPECERKVLIDSIKKFYSVAVDTIDENFRLVGETRLCRYGCFLLKNYYPLHDDLCYEEGRLMKQFATGTDEEKQEAKKMLSAFYGRMKKHREKYFAF